MVSCPRPMSRKIFILIDVDRFVWFTSLFGLHHCLVYIPVWFFLKKNSHMEKLSTQPCKTLNPKFSFQLNRSLGERIQRTSIKVCWVPWSRYSTPIWVVLQSGSVPYWRGSLSKIFPKREFFIGNLLQNQQFMIIHNTSIEI